MENSKLAVDSVTAINDNTVTVTFNKAIEAASADNFKVEGLSVTGAALSEDKKTVTLKTTTATAGNTYNLTIAGLMIAGEEQPTMKATYTVQTASAIYGLEMTTEGNVTTIDAENGKSVLVEVKVLDNKGEFVQDGEVEIEFDSTFGSFAEKRVTVQNGVAKVLFQSETLTEERTANLTAVVKEATNTNLIGLKQELSLVMKPVVAGGEKEEVGAQLTDITVNQAERIMLHFNKEVDAKELNAAYLAKNPKVSIDVVNANVKDITAGAGNKKVRGFKAVPGNNKAVYAIMEKTDYLTDNEYVTVKFTDNRAEIAGEGIATKVLTDFRDPAMLDVQVADLKTLKVVFSEPVHDKTTDGTSATNPNNWVIDGNKLNVAKIWGEGAKVEVGEFDPKTGEDNRHIATITLGKVAEGKDKGDQIYFKPGKHTIQGAGIGDWANLTDTVQNTLNTQSLKFEVPVDNEAPKAEVLVQSPEQYIVKFNKTLGKELKASDIKLQKRVVAENGEVSWVEPTITVDGKDKTQQIRVTRLANHEYKVEVTEDWTNIYNTEKSNLNYYNDTYRLFIAEGKVTTAGNGVKNAEQSLVLGGAMTTPDTTSPVIEDYKFNANTQSGVVTMSEPVKFPTGGDDLLTQSQAQAQAEAEVNKIPQPTADFIGKDKDGKIVTIPAKAITNSFVDDYDMKFVVEPTKDLAPGEWTIVVRSISDDIGNTAASSTFKFTVEQKDAEVIEGKFAVAWADAHTFKDVTSKPAHGTGADDDNPEKEFDVVHVKFTKPVATTGEEGNALRTTAYTVNGKKLPLGSNVIADIAGHDDQDKVVDSVTILLPKGTISEGQANSTTITVSPELLTADGTEKLTNGGLHKLPTNTLYAAAVAATEKAEATLNKAVADAKEVPNKDDKHKLAELIKAGEKAQQQVEEALIIAHNTYTNPQASDADKQEARIALLQATNAAEKATADLDAAVKVAEARETLAAEIEKAKDLLPKVKEQKPEQAKALEEAIEAAEKALKEEKDATKLDKQTEALTVAISEAKDVIEDFKTYPAEINGASISADGKELTFTTDEAIVLDKGVSIAFTATGKDGNAIADIKGSVATAVNEKKEVILTLDKAVDATNTITLTALKDAKEVTVSGEKIKVLTIENFNGSTTELKLTPNITVVDTTAVVTQKVEGLFTGYNTKDQLKAGVTAEKIAEVEKEVLALPATVTTKVDLVEAVEQAKKLLNDVTKVANKLASNGPAEITEADIDTLAQHADYNEGIKITGKGPITVNTGAEALKDKTVTVDNGQLDVTIAKGTTIKGLVIAEAATKTVTINGTVTNLTINDPTGVRLVVGETGTVTIIEVTEKAGNVTLDLDKNSDLNSITATVKGDATLVATKEGKVVAEVTKASTGNNLAENPATPGVKITDVESNPGSDLISGEAAKAAVYTFTLSGDTVSEGTLVLTAGEKTVEVAVTADQTLTAVATAVATAIENKKTELGFTAQATEEGTVVLTATEAGETNVFGDIKLADKVENPEKPTGVTATGEVTTEGTAEGEDTPATAATHTFTVSEAKYPGTIKVTVGDQAAVEVKIEADKLTAAEVAAAIAAATFTNATVKVDETEKTKLTFTAQTAGKNENFKVTIADKKQD